MEISVGDLKKQANVFFGLGQFSDAEKLYTEALDLLESTEPSEQSQKAVLYSNRAASRLPLVMVSMCVTCDI